jgi:hypothetical protein
MACHLPAMGGKNTANMARKMSELHIPAIVGAQRARDLYQRTSCDAKVERMACAEYLLSTDSNKRLYV